MLQLLLAPISIIALLVKRGLDLPSKFTTKANNMNLLCDIKVLYGLACLSPMLEVVNNFTKLSQACDVFVHYMVVLSIFS